jgi:hypothetical protein
VGEFLDAALGFPAVLFSSALVVVVGYWLLVLVGAAEHDAFDGDIDTDAAGLGGVPVTVAVSLLTVLSWFISLFGGLLLHRAGIDGPAYATGALGVLALALLIAWRTTRLAVRPLRALFPDEPAPSRHDFVGRTCVIRTGRVSTEFGQAEVTARDGSTAVVQVRQTGEDDLRAGSTALLYAYDDAREFFWVAPFDLALDAQPEAA